jgi:hypothetical protein
LLSCEYVGFPAGLSNEPTHIQEEVRQQFKPNSSHRANLTWVSAGSQITNGEHHMSLVTLVITIGVVGVLLWLVNRFIPMQGQIKSILNGVVVIALVIWLLKVFGLLDYLTQFRVGH